MMVYQPEKLKVSKEILEQMNPKPKVLIELGTYVGNSAVAWGAILKEINSGKSDGVKVYGMELEPNMAKIASDFVDLAGLSDCVEVVQGQSSDSLRKLKQEGKIDKIDVLFIDHWEKFYLSDLQLCEDLGILRKGTVVIADNTDMPGAPDYLKYLESGGRPGKIKYESKILVTDSKGPVSGHHKFHEIALY
jgi:catechol O-methyltransferase